MARSSKLCFICLGRSDYGEDHTKMRICGINCCKETCNRLFHRDKFVNTNIEEAEKKKRHNPSQKESKQRVMRDLIQRQCMLQKHTKVVDEIVVLPTMQVILKNRNRRCILNMLLDYGN